MRVRAWIVVIPACSTMTASTVPSATSWRAHSRVSAELTPRRRDSWPIVTGPRSALGFVEHDENFLSQGARHAQTPRGTVEA